MRKLKRWAVFFVSGGVGYAVIELLWRGYTHWTMVIAGGICFIIFSEIAKKYKNIPLLFKALLSAVGVTLIELVFGVVFNIVFKMGVWDYSNMPLNFLGQICLGFSVLWVGLAMVFVPIAGIMNRWLCPTEAKA